MRIESEEAFVLHTRAYRESSQLVDLLTRNHGRVRVVARGARRSSKRNTPQLMPFTLLQVGWSGKSELKTLVASEIMQVPPFLRGRQLYSGFYLNELIIRLMAEHDPHECLFDHYQHAVGGLAAGADLESILRLFEIRLLEEVGYELVLDVDVVTGKPVSSDSLYRYDALLGGVEQCYSAGENRGEQPALFSGHSLLAITALQFTTPKVLNDAKRLLRLALQPHLGDRPLQSRKLFQPMEISQ